MIYTRSKYLIISIILLGITYAACSQSPEQTKGRTSTLQQNTTPLHVDQRPVLKFDSAQLVQFFIRYPNLTAYAQSVSVFYSKRSYTFAWFKDNGLVEQAALWSNRLLNSGTDGVNRSFYYQQVLDSLMDKERIKSATIKPDLNLELLLSCLYFQYSNVAWNGMDDAASRSASWLIPRKNITYDEYLDSILNTPVNRPLPREPVYRQYELLKSQLKKYRGLQKGGAWTPIVTANEASKPGDTSNLVLKVKRRLFLLGDFEGDTMRNLYDNGLAVALKRFQQRHGLKADGSLNASTVAELNVPVTRRIQQIVVNMERSRWLPLHVSGDYVAVNIPEFKMHVYHADSLLWSCNAVVGKMIHPTVQFYGDIKYVVFSPYWNVPPGILRNEIMPGMKKDPNYLAKHNMEVTGHRNGTPVVRQKPGRSNSLGQVKFLFPNSYNIYLHDTPAKSLFNESSRAFSHGCIRISEPQKLAAFLLKTKAEWDTSKIHMAMQAGKEKSVTLVKPVPVFIAYFTAFVDRENRLNFRKDIYNLDNKLAGMILSGDGNLK
jgi:murein L,D-transpeptidase YcbB/YkuD